MPRPSPIQTKFSIRCDAGYMNGLARRMVWSYHLKSIGTLGQARIAAAGTLLWYPLAPRWWEHCWPSLPSLVVFFLPVPILGTCPNAGQSACKGIIPLVTGTSLEVSKLVGEIPCHFFGQVLPGLLSDLEAAIVWSVCRSMYLQLKNNSSEKIKNTTHMYNKNPNKISQPTA